MWLGMVQDTQTIGNNKVNEFRFQYARRGLHYFFIDAPGGSNVAIQHRRIRFLSDANPIPSSSASSSATSSPTTSHGPSAATTPSSASISTICRSTATFTVNYGGVYNFSSLDARSLGFANLCAATARRGTVPDFPGFHRLQAFGLGIPSTLVQGIGNPKDSFSNKPLGVFWQDSFRVRQNLTFNLGVRYDVEFPPQFAPPDALALAAYNQLGLQKGIQTDTNNIQPRIGVAWNPRGDGKSVFARFVWNFLRSPVARSVLPGRCIRRLEERTAAVCRWQSLQPGSRARCGQPERDQHFSGHSDHEFVPVRPFPDTCPTSSASILRTPISSSTRII